MRPCLTAGLVEVPLLRFSGKSASASGRTAFHGRSSFPRIGLAATVASPALCLLQIRVDNDTPSFAAITCVAPGVRFSDLAIFVTPALALAIVFICRTSSLVHSRRTIFLVLAIVTPVLVDRPCITRLRIGNRERYETRTRPRLRISSGRWCTMRFSAPQFIPCEIMT
jgi:hypothetical protein